MFGATSPTSTIHQEETIKALESKVEELSSTQHRIAQENNGLKNQLEVSVKVVKENESLRYANSQYQIEYDRLVEELKERDNDEDRYSKQVKNFYDLSRV